MTAKHPTTQENSPLADLPAQKAAALPAPEIIKVTDHHVHCDGGGAINPALGHPRVYLVIPTGYDFVDCSYCDRRFELRH